MTDAACLELLASRELAVQAAQRSLTIARIMAEAHRAGVPPPAVVLDAYLMSVERDEQTLKALREGVAQMKGLFRTH